MPLLPDITFSTLKRDFDTLVAEMLDRATYFCKEWTDRSLSDPGVTMIHVVAWVLDAYYWVSDMLLNEAFIATCKRRSSLINHLSKYGTEVHPPTAATSTLRITTVSVDTTVALAGATIKKGWKIQASLPGETLVYEIQSNVDLGAVNEYVDIPVREGRTLSALITLGHSTGRPFQRFLVNSTSVLHNESQKTIKIRIGPTNDEWTEVDSLALSTPSDKHFEVRRRSDDYPEVIFGDGERGAIPTTALAVKTIYTEGGGSRGNKAAKGTLTQIISSVPYGYRLSVTNTVDATGGSDWETYEHARARGPAGWAAQDRAVATSDYEGIVLAEVADVVAVRAAPTGLNTVSIWAVPNGGGYASALLVSEIRSVIQDRIATDGVTIGTWDAQANAFRSVIYCQIDIIAYVRVREGNSRSTVKNALVTAIQNWLAPNNQSFGAVPYGSVYLSDLYELIEGTAGVYSSNVVKFSRKSTPFWERKTGDASIIEASVDSDTTPIEKWWVEFISTRQFKVRGEESGGRGIGITNSTFADLDGYFSFKISDGTLEMGPGDRMWFRTSKRVGNVLLEANEFPALGELNIILEGGY